jgi:hypothetical protein
MTKFAALVLLSGSLMFGAPRPETSTYVDGNVTSLKPNTGGTLVFTDDNSMMFRTGLAEVAVPYASILRAELGATQTHGHDEPAYKLWALPKRLHKTETQLLTLEFKNGLGESQTMTLELSKPAASSVLSTIEEKTAKPAEAKAGEKAATASASASAPSKDLSKDAWWGDSYWKTSRNQGSWGGR